MKDRKISWIQLISIVINIFLLAEVVVLAMQNRELKNQMSTMSKIIAPEPLAINDTVRSFIYTKIEGEIDSVRYNKSDMPYLLFVYSITCPHCEKNWSIWQDIVNSINKDEINALRLSINSIEKTKEHLLKKSIDAIATGSIAADTTFRRNYKIASVPQTIFINSEGITKGIWVGEIKPEQKQEIIERCRKGIDIK